MDSPDEHFESPEGLVVQARDQTDHLAKEIKAFFDNRPYVQFVDHDRETGLDVHKVRLTSKLPAKLGRTFKDATSNLRDALDHAVYASAVSLGAIEPEKTAFPFAKDATDLNSKLRSRNFKDVPAEIYPILCSFEPYSGGNNLLIALNRVRNPYTHRIIVPFATATMTQEFEFHGATIAGGFHMPYSWWNPAKNEVEYFRIAPNSEFKYKVQIAFDVTLGKIEIVGGRPVTGFLYETITEVDRVVSGIKAETARILRKRST